jgi:hypothetical protein
MIRAFESEIVKLRRPAVLWGTIGTMVAIAVLATALAFATGGGSSTTFNGGRPGAVDVSHQALESAGGWAKGFQIGAGFGGVVLLIVFAVNVATEFSGGTIRTLLLAEPRRTRVLGGKLLGLVALVAVGFLFAAGASIVTSLIAAPIKGIDTGNWFSAAGVRELGLAYADATLAGIGWGLFGAAIAILLRSLLATLGVVLVWFFPLENILHTSWATADRWFPGLLLQGIRPDIDSDTWARRVLILAGYVVVALALACWSFRRRDVTA